MRALEKPIRLRYQILVFVAARTLVNTGYRMVYPFLPVLARGVGASVEGVTLAVTARSMLGFFGPLFGSLADSRGRRFALFIGLGVAGGGALLVFLWPTYPALFLAVLLMGGGKIVYDAALHAYVGDTVDYGRRGLAIGLTEMSWSAAFLLGIPLAGWLIERAGWSAPFPWLAALLLAAAVVLWRILPGDAPARSQRPSFVQGLRAVLAHRPALAGLTVSMLISGGNEVVNIVFGVWLEDSFGLQVAALGAAAMTIGIAELGGEGLEVFLADRLGKRRAAALGIAASILTALALPALGTSLEGALLGLFLFFITFEFTIVTTIALMTELAPAARATLMAGNVAFLSLGRAAGALLGPALFALGLPASSIAAALIYGLSLAVLLGFVRE